MKLLIPIFLILAVSACTCTVPKFPVYLEPDYPVIDAEKEINQQLIHGTPFYKIHRDTLAKLTVKNNMRRNFIKKLQAQIEAINNQ